MIPYVVTKGEHTNKQVIYTVHIFIGQRTAPALLPAKFPQDKWFGGG